MKTVTIPVWALACAAIAILAWCVVFGMCLGRIIEQEHQLRFYQQLHPAADGPGWFQPPELLEM